MNRKFGVSGLDELMKNGLNQISSLALLGLPGTNKEIFSYSFIEEGISNDEPSLYFCSNQRPDSVYNEFDDRGISQSNFLEIMDGYSWKLREKKINHEFSLNSSNLNEFLKVYDKARKQIGDGGRTVIDSLTNLVGFDELSVVNNFFQIILAEENNSNNLILISLTPNYREGLVNLTKSYVDGFIELRKHEGKKYLKLHWLGELNVDNRWFRYTQKRGIREDSSLSIEVGEALDEETD